jgi:hypothetical protein
MFVIGNGESRKNINLDRIDQIKIGCNAILRDWSMNHLICCDRKMVLESIAETDLQKTTVYTRPEYIHMHPLLKSLPTLPYDSELRQDQPIHWGSGHYAVLLATQLNTENETINLLGFDLYGMGEHINNVYKDSHGYNRSSDRAVDPRYWIHQLSKIFEINAKMQFQLYVPDNFIKPKDWNHTNLTYQSLTKLRQ